jgi:histidinol phosphatase-like enzyme
MKKVIIIDRDGVLNVNSKNIYSPYYYILEKKDLILTPGAETILKRLKSMDFKVVLATRQRCVEKGLITMEEAIEINNHLCEKLGFNFDKIYIQPNGNNKKETFKKIIKDYEADLYFLLDDSESECAVARELGIMAINTKTDIFWKKIFYED